MKDLRNVKNGFDFNDIDLEKFLKKKPSVSTEKKSKAKSLNQFHKLYKKITDASRLMIALLFTSIVLLLVGIYILWGRTSINSSALHYASVGPVITTIGSGQAIKIKLKFEFKNPNLQNRMVGMESLIKDKILMILASLDEKDILGEQSLKSLKDRIKSVADGFFKDNVIENIYFSEIQMFNR